jgi:hypothetical protein
VEDAHHVRGAGELAGGAEVEQQQGGRAHNPAGSCDLRGVVLWWLILLEWASGQWLDEWPLEAVSKE